MPAPVLATKLYIPPPRPGIVPRPHLTARLNAGLHHPLTLISAPAGFGKTTLVSEWVATCGRPVAWLALDEGDSDSARFLTYFIAALQKINPPVGAAALAALQSPQPPPSAALLTPLLNDLAAIPDRFVLVLDDYHLLDAPAVDEALTFLIEHAPPQMHLVITTREDPSLPLARLRARGQLAELRAADLRFTPAEAAEFLTRGMGLRLSAPEIAALEARTEGWIAGLQLAALSLQNRQDTASIIESFTGSHRFVLDYLLEEVLQRQPEEIQTFLLRTSILERLCGPLCDAVLRAPAVSGQPALEYLEHANLFIVSLDSERRWYRYHHLFRDILRQRLGQGSAPAEIAALHIHASEWFERHGLLFEAFQHAAAASDVARAARLIENEAIGLHFRSVALPILSWLTSLPQPVLDANPRLWVRAATTALMTGQSAGVEAKLQAAEAAFAAQAASPPAEPDAQTRDLIGQMACARATLAIFRYDPVEMTLQARRALAHLHPDNLTYRFTANWALTSALMFQGDRAEATQACQASIDISQKSGHVFSKILAASNMGMLQEMENQLHQAAETYHQVLQLFGDHPQPNATVALLGLARICYEWNDLPRAEQYGQRSLQMAQQLDRGIDRYLVSEVFLARLKLARGDVEGAAAQLAQAEQAARQNQFRLRLPEIAAAQALVLLRQGRTAAAAQLVQSYALPRRQAQVALAQGDPAAALAILTPLRQQMGARGWADERLRAMNLQALALHAQGEKEAALQVLGEVLALAEPGGFVRLFVDQGPPMQVLLAAGVEQGLRPAYLAQLLAAFAAQPQADSSPGVAPASAALVEALNGRELEILRLIAQGLSNQEIGARLFLALDTVKGYNRRIFGKLQVQRRTEAIARARELGIL